MHGDSQCIFPGAEGVATPGWEDAGYDGSGAATCRAAPTDRRLAGRHWTQPNAARCCVRPREGHLKTQGPEATREAYTREGDQQQDDQQQQQQAVAILPQAKL